MEHGYHLGLRHNMLITRRLSQVTRINKGNLLCIMFCIRENGCPQEKCRTLCIKGINKMLMG
ncbi:hypothetical protein ZEAMMB73_Zm00001d016238 [Zea mays]|nr:hypothetical protein ZEAMMB73_Zm00001d016238 [Zea mays]AQK70356.1 hypothetical protein ZEAMMB73_Zm00001d016238 [Zea mays]AQK70360.1 hypothetical protein ZEAMMB73_Zm00001d016238 [Zea mays]AQK70365.1 hypothetical protein ZEAMMB73_Zm00001d016238 [Zea mays]